MLTIKKLNAMPYAQSHIEIDEEGNWWLFSYTTLVAGVYHNWAWCNGTYSQTTRRHIGSFAKEIGDKYNLSFSYHSFKKLYEEGIEMNLLTGETREVNPTS